MDNTMRISKLNTDNFVQTEVGRFQTEGKTSVDSKTFVSGHHFDQPPDLLILDEPTNHLDLENDRMARSLFCQRKHYLIYGDTRPFLLERVCNEIIELDGKLYSYKGNYSYYLEKKKRAHCFRKFNVDKAQNLFRKELEWMRRPKAEQQNRNRVRKIFTKLKTKHKVVRRKG
jgi:ATP-binding cassette subfamily F protein uup